jgi:hypothetical protein
MRLEGWWIDFLRSESLFRQAPHPPAPPPPLPGLCPAFKRQAAGGDPGGARLNSSAVVIFLVSLKEKWSDSSGLTSPRLRGEVAAKPTERGLLIAQARNKFEICNNQFSNPPLQRR